jgi:WD40 repeat protein
MSTAQPTVVPSPAPGIDGWRQRLRDRGQLAGLGFGGSAPYAASQLSAVRHLAFLPAEALELDLDDPAQRQFGAYELREKLGQGGMGVVYRAYQPALDREVAIKLLAAGPWASAEFIARFQREAQHAARLNHPNIVPIHEIGTHEELHFFSMALVRGQTLARRIADEGPLPAQIAAGMLLTIAEALDYAHRLGVLHLDLKPGNVLLDERHIPMVADFGLARRLDQSLALDSDEVSGTPSYMAPEQATLKSHKLSPATDIYGLGAILYEMLSGRPPFLGSTPQETLKRVVAEQPEPLRTRKHDVPPDLEAVCLHCLAKHPKDRYRSARELAGDLRRFIEGRPVSVRPLNGWQLAQRWAKREPRVAGAVAFAAFALIAGLVATTAQWRRAESAAQSARETGWSARREVAANLLARQHTFDALAPILANLREQDAIAQTAAMNVDRRRVGAVFATGPRLVDALDLGARVVGTQFSPDGSVVAVALADGNLVLIDPANGRERWRTEVAAAAQLEWLRFTPDGGRILGMPNLGMGTARPHGLNMQMFDAATGAVVSPPPQFAEFVDATFSHDGRLAVLRNRGKQAQVWRTAPWEPAGPMAPHDGTWMFSPDGLLVAVCDRSFTRVRVLDPTTMQPLFPSVQAPEYRFGAWAFSPDSRSLALGEHDGRVLMLDSRTGARRNFAGRADAHIRWLSFSEDGVWLVATATDQTVRVWAAGGGAAPVAALAVDRLPLYVLVDHAHGLLVTGVSGVLRAWRIPPTGYALQVSPAADWELRLGEIAQSAFAVHAGRGWLATGNGADRMLRLWRLPRSPLLDARGPRQWVDGPLHFDGEHVVEVIGRAVRIVDAATLAPRSSVFMHAQPVGYAALASDGRTLVTSNGRELRTFDWRAGVERGAAVVLPATPVRVAISDDGARYATAYGEQVEGRYHEVIQIREFANGTALGPPHPVPGPLSGWRLAPRGDRVALWHGGEVRLCDATGAMRCVEPIVLPDEMGVLDLVFASDGATVFVSGATGTGDRRAMWQHDAQTGTQRQQWNNLDGGSALAMHPDGEHLSYANADGLSISLLGLDGRERHLATGSMSLSPAAFSSVRGVIALPRASGVLVVDAGSGEALTGAMDAPIAYPDSLQQLAFDANGGRLLGRTFEGRWLLWKLPDDQRSLDRIAREAVLAGMPGTDEPGRAPATVDARERDVLRTRDPGPRPELDPLPIEPVAARPDGLEIPVRDSRAPTGLVDLTAHYNGALGEYLQWGGEDSLSSLPRGIVRLAGVDFDLRGFIRLVRTESNHLSLGLPERVEGIAVPSHFSAIHVLLAGYFPRARAGDRVAALIVNYRDGGELRLPIVFGRDLLSSYGYSYLPRADDVPMPRIAWTGRVPTSFGPATVASQYVLYDVRLTNPRPDRAVASIALEAGDASAASAVPMFFALTVDTPVANAPPTDTP